MRFAVARGIALFLGAFTLVNLAGSLRGAAFDANGWWIDLWPLPAAIGDALLAVLGVTMVAWAFVPRASGPRALLGLASLVVVALFALVDAARFYVVLARGGMRTTVPLPLSLLVAATLVFLLIQQLRGPNLPTSRVAFAYAFVGAAIAFPLLQISLFGITDYRRPADVIVVFGAKAYEDGTPSPALADRVRTACALYRDGVAPRLFFSGGRVSEAMTEAESMRRMALRLGVPDSAIVLDDAGVNTEATVRNAMTMARGRRIIAVSHFYHLPRVKMTFHRYGSEVYTVPSENTLGLYAAWVVAREDAAFWRYYVR